MIFVTLGSTHYPFDRFLQGVAALTGEDLVVQHGTAPPPPNAHRVVPFLSFPEIVEYMAAARAVVTHAGVGSILCALRAGQTPVVVPRLKRYGETVDDHQAELARALGETGTVVPVWDMQDLPRAVAEVPTRHAAAATATDTPLHRALHDVLTAGRLAGGAAA